MSGKETSGETKDDKFARLWKRADEMFERMDEMFKNFPGASPLDLDQLFNSRTVTSYYTNPVEDEVEPRNNPCEYMLVETPSFFSKESKTEDIEKWLNVFGADGWDLNCFEFGHAIFSRYIEDADEDEDEDACK